MGAIYLLLNVKILLPNIMPPNKACSRLFYSRRVTGHILASVVYAKELIQRYRKAANANRWRAPLQTSFLSTLDIVTVTV